MAGTTSFKPDRLRLRCYLWGHCFLGGFSAGQIRPTAMAAEVWISRLAQGESSVEAIVGENPEDAKMSGTSAIAVCGGCKSGNRSDRSAAG